ncbi:adenylate/guanylate cyclase [Thecamonas trahens ATCC 50062]|uniref:Adenylate/guanylate cyclase n=1 Tax=Thecamonas trahens ATCC 50062 TaxID=461836 RepID=A0A0L0DTK7_THETB|nr:adenylate/guanylate cyclase [Thecamonas trahens ATCC 50062]KNC55391.1 adenylate/guanylate cyclase [Thecamonas trahens ATCC 50062]|eukprot:XP_013753023.1 adenylate/guanylate cyclase [Thecamonas trahens ATCC 50062]
MSRLAMVGGKNMLRLASRVALLAAVVCLVVERCAAVCGDGILEPLEVCDDGNRVGYDGCSSVCLNVDYGYECATPGAACTRLFTCGDGVVESPHETCDDGNKVSGDGCGRDCLVEGGYSCTGGPSVCSANSVCGDGFVDASEACDTGSAPADGCESCTTVSAGYFCPLGGSPCYLRNCTKPAGSYPPPGEDVVAGEHHPDCMGVCGGFAFVDECGVCAGGTSGVLPNSAKDHCGVCFGKNIDKDSCNVCFGTDFGVDACGVCFGNNATCRGCDGVLNSGKRDDACGICDGDGSSCMGCDGIPVSLGGSIYDECGVCGGNNTAPCIVGCDGVVGSGLVYDCAGVCNGTKVRDVCGVCLEPDSPLFDWHKTASSCNNCFGGHGTSLPYVSPDSCGINCPLNDCTGHALDACGVYSGSGDTCDSTCGTIVPMTDPTAKVVDNCGTCGGGDFSGCLVDTDCTNRVNAADPLRYDCRGMCNTTGTVYAPDLCGACSPVALALQHSVITLCGCFQGKDSLDECNTCKGQSNALDECMVCSGGNTNKDMCGVCFGYGQLRDSCGTCNGTNNCVGCDYIPYSNRTVVCDECGGDGSACAAGAQAESERFTALMLMGGGSLFLLCCVGIIGVIVYRRRQRSFVSKYEKRRAAELGNHPTGEVTIVFTDIEGSTSLWENFPTIMPKTIETHHSICRRAILENNGYEVKTEGDAFMIAFHQPIDAISFCGKMQLMLMKQKWPAQIMNHPYCKVEKDSSGKVVFKGLRVRMGVHTGYPSCRKDDNTGIMDYFGSMVNRAARVEHAASGGQILASARCYEACRVVVEAPKSPYIAVSLGEKHFKGIKGRMAIYQIMPRQLASRPFKAVTSYVEKAAPSADQPSATLNGSTSVLAPDALSTSSSEDDEFDAFRAGTQRAGAAFQAGW